MARINIYTAIYTDVNYGVEFKFQPGVVLFLRGTTITATHIKSGLRFETTDDTGIFDSMQDDRTSWFNPKHVMLTFDYPNDKLIVTRKSTGQQITLTIPDIYKEKSKKTGKYIIEDTYTEYLKHKHHDLENHKKKHEIIPYRIELLKDLIRAIENHNCEDEDLMYYILPLQELVNRFEDELAPKDSV